MEDRETRTGSSTPSDEDSPAEMTGAETGGLSDMSADDESEAEAAEASAVTQSGMETGGDPPDRDAASPGPAIGSGEGEERP